MKIFMGEEPEQDLVSPKWVADAQKKLDEKGWNNTKLADAVKVDAAVITRLFRHNQWCRKIGTIAKVLGMPRPYVLISTDEEEEWIELGRVMRETDPKEFTSLLTALREKAETDSALARESAAAQAKVDAILERKNKKH